MREAFFPSAVQHYAVETARPSDGTRSWRSPPATCRRRTTALVADWWDAVAGRLPRGAQPARDRGGRTRSCASSRRVPQRPVRARPDVPGAGASTCARTRCRRGSACSRRGLRSPTAPAPRPRRASARCCATSSAPRWSRPACGGSTRSPRRRPDAQIEPLGYAPPIAGGDATESATSGPESVAGWLSELAARDARRRGDRLDAPARELTLDGHPIALTKLECAVLRYLHDQKGSAVSRAALAARGLGPRVGGRRQRRRGGVSGLRRKLGAQRQSGGDRARRRLPPHPSLALSRQCVTASTTSSTSGPANGPIWTRRRSA